MSHATKLFRPKEILRFRGQGGCNINISILNIQRSPITMRIQSKPFRTLQLIMGLQHHSVLKVHFQNMVSLLPVT